jgi:hypothetical protein
MRRRTAVFGAAGLLAALVPFLAPPAGAGTNGLTVSANPTGNQPQAEWDWTVVGEPCLSDTQVTVPGLPGATITIDTPNGGSVLLPVDTPAPGDRPGGAYVLEVTCTTDAGTQSGSGVLVFARILVAKEVLGNVPPDAQFTIVVDCFGKGGGGAALPEAEGTGPIFAELTYGSAGGIQQLIGYFPQICTIAETDDGGAQAVTVDTEDCGDFEPEGTEGIPPGDVFFVADPVDCTQTVTNEFAPAQVEPDEDEPDVVAATPPFTG